MNYQRTEPYVPDEAILNLWDRGLDTLAIAKRWNAKESNIANRLPRLLFARRVAAERLIMDAQS